MLIFQGVGETNQLVSSSGWKNRKLPTLGPKGSAISTGSSKDRQKSLSLIHAECIFAFVTYVKY